MKRTGHRRRRVVVDGDGVVCFSRAEAIALGEIGRVRECAGIHEHGPSPRGELDREGIRMRMAAVVASQGSAIDDTVVRVRGPSIAGNEITTLGKRARWRGQVRSTHVLEAAEARRSEKPHQFPSCRSGDLAKIRAIEHDRRARERTPKIVRRPAVQRKETPSVVVADKGRGSIRTLKVHQVLNQRLQGADDVSRVNVGCDTQAEELQIKIRGIALVIARLLEVHAVGTNVSLDLLSQDAPTETPPAARAPQLWEKRAEIDETERLSGQMRVGAEICREIAFDVQAVSVQYGNGSGAYGIREVARVAKECQRPDPGNRAKRYLEAARPIHAARRWVFIHPADELTREREGVPVVSR